MSNRKFENEGADIARRLKFLGPGYKSDPWGAITPVAGYVQKPDANGYLSYVGGNGGASGTANKITKEMNDQLNAVEKAKWQKANANAKAASYPNTNVGSPAQVAANTAVSGGGTASPSFASPYNAGLQPNTNEPYYGLDRPPGYYPDGPRVNGNPAASPDWDYNPETAMRAPYDIPIGGSMKAMGLRLIGTPGRPPESSTPGGIPQFETTANAGLQPDYGTGPAQAAAAAPVQTPAQAAAQKAVSPYQAWLDGSQGQQAAGAGQLLADEAARIRAGGGPTMDSKKISFLTTLADQHKKYTDKVNAPTLQQRREQMWDSMHKKYGSDKAKFVEQWLKYTSGH